MKRTPSLHDHLRERLHAQAGIFECAKPKITAEEFRKLRNTQWSPHFETLMRNRLWMGLLRYGRLGAANKPSYDMVQSIIRRAKEYVLTGNDELLVDIANLAMVEFVEGRHPLKHFEAKDGGDHCTPK